MAELSKTPRTDALTNGIDRLANEHPEIVALCRELELSISEERRALAEAKDAWAVKNAEWQAVKRERDEARKMRDTYKKWATDRAAEADEYREYAELARKALEDIASVDPVDAALDPQRAARIAREALGTCPEISKVQCGGSGSLSETLRPSTAHPLAAGHKPEQQFDDGPSASGPATQPEPRTTFPAIGTMTASERRDALMEECDDWIAAYTPDFKTHQYDWTDLREAWFIGRASTVPSQGNTEASDHLGEQALADARRWRWWRAKGMKVISDGPKDWTRWVALACIPYRSLTDDPDELTDALIARFPLSGHAQSQVKP